MNEEHKSLGQFLKTTVKSYCDDYPIPNPILSDAEWEAAAQAVKLRVLEELGKPEGSSCQTVRKAPAVPDEVLSLRSQLEESNKRATEYATTGSVMLDLLKKWIDGGECFCTSEGVAYRGPCEYCLTKAILEQDNLLTRRYLTELGEARTKCDSLQRQLTEETAKVVKFVDICQEEGWNGVENSKDAYRFLREHLTALKSPWVKMTEEERLLDEFVGIKKNGTKFLSMTGHPWNRSELAYVHHLPPFPVEDEAERAWMNLRDDRMLVPRDYFIAGFNCARQKGQSQLG